jgi:quinone-modifying oxidoreductase subunit QmoC
LLAAIRHESVVHHSVPRFFARWVNQPKYLPLVIGLPVLLLGLALLLRDRLADLFGISDEIAGKIVYSYSSVYPHWLLNGFFAFFGALALLAMIAGVARFWQTLKGGHEIQNNPSERRLLPSLLSALRSIISHDNFSLCTVPTWRFPAHLGVFFGFIALTTVTLWVITAKINPLIQSDFVYPFSFWSPWKMLANVGGIALLAGCLLMIWDRLEYSDRAGSSTFFDWSFLGTLLIVVMTGFITEIMHYLRLEPHRHFIYFIHLVFVFVLLIYLPYSKFAHVIYRTTAMVYAEYSGRTWGAAAKAIPSNEKSGSEEEGQALSPAGAAQVANLVARRGGPCGP